MKLNIERTIQKDDIIRLSEGEVKSHYYEDKYMRSLGIGKGFTIEGDFTGPSGLLNCIVYKF